MKYPNRSERKQLMVPIERQGCQSYILPNYLKNPMKLKKKLVWVCVPRALPTSNTVYDCILEGISIILSLSECGDPKLLYLHSNFFDGRLHLRLIFVNLNLWQLSSVAE